MGNKIAGSIVGMTTLVVIVAVAACAASGALGGYTVDLGTWVAYSPQANAQATRVALEALDQARAREIERQQAQAEADATKAASPALVLRNVLVAAAVGVGSLVLALGGAFAAVAWLSKKATAVYPNAAGQYPVIIRRSWNGVTIVHDPNRALGPTTIYTGPSLVGSVAARLGLPAGETRAEFPQPGSEAAMVQIASQAQAGQVAAAQHRWPRLPAIARNLSVRGDGWIDDEVGLLPEPGQRMPRITVIEDRERLPEVRGLLMEAGGG